ncbi:transmembrane channel-like protein 3 isoform X2 [Corticium candelabrum]|uniref:transmembrane channel-like protein 3 isoform X2 n=1 Tax=Corticium candelabrum TaxID=121492 RepID=UPI002E2616AA|nr:transmembrane channel-like protein 3 isoform X2 [Corticium candelabrum]
MSGTEILLQHEDRILEEGVARSAPAKTRSKLKSRKDILSPSEQLRRGRYEHHDDTEVYVNLLQLREEIAISSRRASYDDEIDDENEPYETDLEHLQDVRNAVKHLRAVPVFMKNKLEILQLAQELESKKMDHLSKFDNWKYTSHKWKENTAQFLYAIVKFVTPWQSLIAKTEHRLGSGVASYFVFLRWLLGLNLFMFLLLLGFVILPQVRALDLIGYPLGVHTFTESLHLCKQALVGEGLMVSDALTEVDGVSKLSYIVDGKGYLMEFSLLFYGYYDHKSLEITPGVGVYNLPLAFLLTTGAILVICFVLVSRKLLKKDKVVFAARQSFPCTWLTLCSWDHNIAESTVAKYRKRTVVDSLKNTVTADELLERSKKWQLYLVRIVTNVIVVLLCTISVAAVYFTISSATCLLQATSGADLTVYFRSGLGAFPQFFSVLRVPLVVSGLNLVLPAVFEYIAQQNWERLHPRNRLLLTFGRSYIIYLANFVVVLVTLSTHLKSPSQAKDIDGTSCCVDTASNTFPVLLDFPSCAHLATGSVSEDKLVHLSNLCWNNITSTSSSSDIINFFPCLNMLGPDSGNLSHCWETVIGQELFQLLNVDILIEICIGILVLEWGRAFLVSTDGFRCCGKLAAWIGYSSFHTSENVLTLTYKQAIVWLGFFFCPFLPGIALLGMFILFFLRLMSTRVAVRPWQVFREIRHSTRRFYMQALFSMLIVDFCAVGYIIVEKSPSTNCGPFRSLHSMADILVQVIETWPSWLETVITFFKSIATVSLIILILCFLGYYQWQTAAAYKNFQKDLLYQMKVLRNKIQSQQGVSNEQTLPSPRSFVSITTPDGQVNQLQLPRVLPPISDVKLRNRRDQKKQPQLNSATAVASAQHLQSQEENVMSRQPKRNPVKEAKPREAKSKELQNKKRSSYQRTPSIATTDNASEPAQEFEYFNSGFDDLYARLDSAEQEQLKWPQLKKTGGHGRNPKSAIPATSQSYSHVQVPSYMLGTQGDPYQDDYNRPASFWTTLGQNEN